MKRTLVIGASEKPERYSNKAIRKLRTYGHEVVALASRPGRVEDVIFETEKKAFEKIDTVSVYLRPQNQDDFMDYVIGLKPERVIFNPGSENPEFAEKLKKAGIRPEESCTLVLLGTGQY